MSATTDLVRLFGIPYLTTIPAEVPARRIAVHGNGRPTRRLDWRDFLAWLADPSDRLVDCGCGWAGEFGGNPPRAAF